MPEIAQRLTNFSESIIRDMTRVADEHGAINLAQGFPNFDPPQVLIEAAVNALRSGHNQYGQTWGTPSFRQALAKKQTHFMGIELEPDVHITATCGGTEAMLAAFMTVVNPGDKVIVFSPVYENYIPDSILSGAQPIYVPLHPPEFSLDPSELRAAFESGSRALILCNPSNPTGKVFSLEELQIIAGLAQEFDAYVITDEVYEHITYAPHKHTYIASLPGMFERTISTGSLSKTYAVTGWRLGYAIAPPKITDGIRKVHDFLTIGAPTPFQEAAVTALNFGMDYYLQLREEYTQRRDLFLDYLDRAGLEYTRPQGAYYVMLDISSFGFQDDTAFCYWLTKEIGVAAVPGGSFYPLSQNGRPPVTNMARVHFAKSSNVLREAGERLLGLKDR
ncbi:MAG: pyridoxal phosphate-dependent aminotransferase [Anaerolineales bacterium]